MTELSILPPLRPPTTGDLIANVGVDHVRLSSLIQWQNKKGTSGFCHQEVVEDKWTSRYDMTVQEFKGPSWDRRTPVLHSALAGLDTTDAGFDEAYIRALNALSSVFQPRRGEISPLARNFIMRSAKKQYAPAAFLLRGALLWACLGLMNNGVDTMHEWRTTGNHQYAVRIDDVEQFNAALCDTSKEGNDVVYTRIHTYEEAYMIDVMVALTSADISMPACERYGISKLWPKMNRPRVVYNSTVGIGRPGGRISQASVWYAMERFCSIWDCHDLWSECLNFVQVMLLRPVNCGVLAGTKVVRMYWPESDLRVGAIGSLTAGVSPEGMKSKPTLEPNWTEFMYGAAVKGCMFSAATYETLRDMHDAHPAALSLGLASGAVMNKFLYSNGNTELMRDHVGPRLAECGWDFMSTSLHAIGIGTSRRLLHTVLNSGAVPWWTVVAPHVNVEKHDALVNWLKPAQLSKVPRINEWHVFKRLGAVTQEHIAAALWWMEVDVRYRVESANARLSIVKLPKLMTNRFPPVLHPEYKVGATHATAILKFSVASYAKMSFLEDLGRSDIHVIPIQTQESWLPCNTIEEPADSPGVAVDGLGEMSELERMLNDPDFERNMEPELPPISTPGSELATKVEEKIRSLMSRPGLNFGKAILPGDVTEMVGDQHRSIYSAARGVRAITTFAENAVTELLMVPRDERITVVRDMIEVANLVAGDNAHIGTRQMVDTARNRLIGVLQALKQDTALSIEEAGGAPDSITDNDILKRFSHNVMRGQSYKSLLDQAVKASQEQAPGLAPDEPPAEPTTVEDFGEGTSQVGSRKVPAQPAENVDVPSGTLPDIGFLPPGGSSPSAKQPEA
jgi:hypothetical protein